MTDKTSRTAKAASYRAKQVEHIAKVLDRGVSVGGVTRPWVQVFAECVQRGAVSASPDGFKSGAGGVGPKNQISDSTGNTALRRINASSNDPVGEAIHSILSTIDQLERMTNTLSERVKFVLTVDEGIRGRVASVDTCPICKATITGVDNDRVIRGFCRQCYDAGDRAKRAARSTGERFDWGIWEIQRTIEMRAQAAS